MGLKKVWEVYLVKKHTVRVINSSHAFDFLSKRFGVEHLRSLVHDLDGHHPSSPPVLGTPDTCKGPRADDLAQLIACLDATTATRLVQDAHGPGVVLEV